MVGAWAGRVVEPRERQLDQVASGYRYSRGEVHLVVEVVSH